MVKKFVMQWHITECCNLKCKHCYQERHKPLQLKYDQLLDILKQYKELLKTLKIKGHINLTGGEPLSCPFFFELLNEFKKDKNLYSFSILTNGTLINEEIARKISEYNPEYVQVSLEGGKRTNDYIRGKNTYKLIEIGIKNLKKYDIFVSISFTANKLNYKEFPKVVKYAIKNHVNNVWSDRYIPIGEDKTIEPLNMLETREYLEIMQKERREIFKQQRQNNIVKRQNAQNDLLRLYDMGILPPRYRNFAAISSFHDNLTNGLTNSLELKPGDPGAYNLYEQQNRQGR